MPKRNVFVRNVKICQRKQFFEKTRPTINQYLPSIDNNVFFFSFFVFFIILRLTVLCSSIICIHDDLMITRNIQSISMKENEGFFSSIFKGANHYQYKIFKLDFLSVFKSFFSLYWYHISLRRHVIFSIHESWSLKTCFLKRLIRNGSILPLGEQFNIRLITKKKRLLCIKEIGQAPLTQLTFVSKRLII